LSERCNREPKKESRGKMAMKEIRMGHTQNAAIENTYPVSEDGKSVSKEVYLAEYYEHPDFAYEWNNGTLEQKPAARIGQSQIYLWLCLLLQEYLRVNPIAELLMLNIGFELPLADGDRIRLPDLSVVCHDNPVPILPDDNMYQGIFDICIESLSDRDPHEVKRDIEDKWSEYAQAGVKEYYILDDRKDRHMSFFYLESDGQYKPLPSTSPGVIRSQVLPDFQFRVEHLYTQPWFDELVQDSVYQRFVWPEYQAKKRYADALENLADTRQRLAMYATKLRELGIDPDSL